MSSDLIQLRTGTTAAATSADDTLANDSSGAEIGVTDDRTAGVGDVRGWLGDTSHMSWTALHTAQSRGIWATPGDLASDIATLVTGQSSSVDSEVALFSGTGGKTIKRATTTGIAKLTSGVLSAASAGTDYYAPGGTDVAVADGGTGASSASAARTNLGVVIGTDVLAPTGSGASLTGIYLPGGTDVAIADGGTGASTASAARTALGLAIGTDVLAPNGSGSSLTGVYLPGGTDVAVADGGTGSSSAGGARLNLGLVIGTNVQAWDADLDTIAGLTATTDNFIVSVSSAWASRTPAQVKATLAIAESDVTNLTTDLAAKAPLASPTFTGTPAAPTAAQGTNTTQVATTAMVHSEAVLLAPIASPTFTGTVTLPTGLTGIAKLASGVVSAVTAPSGTIVGTTDTQTLTNKRVTPRTDTTASSATPTINTDTTDVFTITALAAAITSMTTNLSGTPTTGQQLLIRIKDNGTARAITWGASFQSSGVATLLATTVISKTHHVLLVWDEAAAKWVCLAVDATGY